MNPLLLLEDLGQSCWLVYPSADPLHDGHASQDQGRRQAASSVHIFGPGASKSNGSRDPQPIAMDLATHNFSHGSLAGAQRSSPAHAPGQELS